MAIDNAIRAKLAAVEGVGCLQTDAGVLAGNVMQALHEGTKVVWADDDARVLMAPASEQAHLPPHWVVGVFDAAETIDEISARLLKACRQRQREFAWRKAG